MNSAQMSSVTFSSFYNVEMMTNKEKADFGAMGVNYLINGEAVGIGDMIDQSFGTIEIYDGLY